MKLHTKLLIGFGSLWLVFLAATGLTMGVIEQYDQSLEIAFHSNFDSVKYCEQMKLALDGYNRLAMNALWDHAGPDAAEVSRVQQQWQQGEAGQKGNITLPGEQTLTMQLLSSAGEYRAAFDQFLLLSDGERLAFYRENLQNKYYAAQDLAQVISQLNLNYMKALDARLRDNLWITRVVQGIFVLIGALLAIGSVIVLARTILTPLRTLTVSAKRIESGDLDLEIDVPSRDEVGQLASAFNSMASRLREYRQLDHARLLRTQQTTQQAIDSLPDAVAVFNPSGQVEISNHQARVHFGFIPAQSTVQDRPKWLQDLLTATFKTGLPVEPQGYETAVQLFDADEERFMLPRAIPMFGDRHQVIGVVVTLVDVTRLRKADELKSGLLATVSHELKTPLAAARFSVQLLAQETVAPLNDRQRKLVAAACEGTDRLHRIIETLLRLHRIEEGQQPVKLQPMSPEDIVRHATETFAGQFKSRGLQLQTEIAAGLPQVLADSELIGYVLTNLLSNSLKFVPVPGTVTITAAQESGQVVFSVCDTGPGVSDEHVAKLFTRFFRADAPAGVPGVGLGLAIARQLVEAHGGTIRYVARPEGGACFQFTLTTKVDSHG